MFQPLFDATRKRKPGLMVTWHLVDVTLRAFCSNIHPLRIIARVDRMLCSCSPFVTGD